MRRSNPEIQQLELNDCNVYVVSDLHMAGGRDAIGNYSGTENFFADRMFSRFLNHLSKDPQDRGKNAVLIVNGDFIDFLRICDTPGSDDAVEEWRRELGAVNIKMSAKELGDSFDNKTERKFGLKTHDFKSVWKLMVCRKGHPEVFESLTVWIRLGNRIVIVKGNHDLEWHWSAVQDYFRVQIGSNQKNEVCFVEDVLMINKSIYIEHGARYENITIAEGSWELENGKELRLPVGSFLNRYLLNKIEHSYPYLDNIRPQSKILPVLIKERFPLAIKVLFHYLPFSIRMIPKKEVWHALRFLVQFLIIVLLPVCLTAYAFFLTWNDVRFSLDSVPSIFKPVFSLVKNLAFLVLSYFLGRILAWVELAPPGRLSAKVKAIKANHADVQLVTFGHTHDPQQSIELGVRYFNTGTWMPVYQLTAADVRLDLSYTFLFFKIDKAGNPLDSKLLRWNDDAERIDPIVLTDTK